MNAENSDAVTPTPDMAMHPTSAVLISLFEIRYWESSVCKWVSAGAIAMAGVNANIWTCNRLDFAAKARIGGGDGGTDWALPE